MIQTTAIAIIINTPSGQRYFSHFGNKSSIQTAWTLAGAKLFMVDAPEHLKPVLQKLTAKNKTFTLHLVHFSSVPLDSESIHYPVFEELELESIECVHCGSSDESQLFNTIHGLLCDNCIHGGE